MLQTRGETTASPPCRYLYWRAPSGFWMRRVRWEEHTAVMPERAEHNVARSLRLVGTRLVTRPQRLPLGRRQAAASHQRDRRSA